MEGTGKIGIQVRCDGEPELKDEVKGEDEGQGCKEIKKMRSADADADFSSEERHYRSVIRTFRNYLTFSRQRIMKTKEFMRSFPENHQRLLNEYNDHLNSLFQCFEVNQQIFDLITEQEEFFENHSDLYSKNTVPDTASSEPEEIHNHGHGALVDFDKCYVVLKQIMRDWSSEGQKERNLCYTPIIEELETRFSAIKHERDVRVLIPGAGLGRLTHEIVRRGYCTEGNEFSMFMLFASNFLLNRCAGKNVYKCYPWVHQHTNVLFHMDQTRPIFFPDIDPSDLPRNLKFSMTAGDFLDVYEKPEHEGAWDCIVTCFFIDCAKNIVAFLERILYCLKVSGVWINLGPLLYHYADTAEEKSIEPPYDFLASIIRRIGFKIEKEILDLPTTYSDNQRSMLSFTYKSVFLVCTKPGEIPKAEPENFNNQFLP